ncbi:MAG: hypothetical protein Q9217_001512 [Psora testacea]
MANIWKQLDDQLAKGLADWNIYTTLLCVIVISYALYPAFFSPEPDVHPLLLARQSAPSRVRQPGESATFRSLDTPHSYPLRKGLNVKDPGQPKWTAGRDGDLRDIWNRAAGGPVDGDGKPTGQPSGNVSVVLGKEEVITYDFGKLTAEINAVGKHLQEHGGTRVGIYLANSIELLVTLFACAFYGVTPILIPQAQPLGTLATILDETQADTLVVGAGAIPLTELVKLYTGLKQVVWVVARTSRHMDWHEVPEGEGGKAGVAVWHEIIDETSGQFELPTELPGDKPPSLVTIAQSAANGHKIVELSQDNLVAAVGAQLAVLPRSYASTATHQMTQADTLLPLASLTDVFPLTVTLAALFSNASLALTSVSGPQAPYGSAFQSVKPNILIAHPQTLSRLCEQNEQALSGAFSKYMHKRKLETLKHGSMPKSSAVLRDVRLIYTYEQADVNKESLTAAQLSNIRLFTGARVIYALTDANVAGAICQTNMLDYQTSGLKFNKPSHFGPPLSCVEVKLVATTDGEIDDDKPIGRLAVSGPAVAGGETTVNRTMMMTDNNTLAYAS